MKSLKSLTVLCVALSCFAVLFSGCASNVVVEQQKEIPHLEKRGDVTQLIVDGKPFIALAGELRNSSSSSAAYMDTIWPKLKKANLNTVLAVVAWEQVEPTEGTYDFAFVDEMILACRKNNLRLSILWFGAWKNGITSYVPSWVQKDQERFPYVLTKKGDKLPILSTLGEETVKADAKAYAALMKHVKEFDTNDRTVIMIQMQNEVGLHGDTRDYHPKAVEMFASAVPSALMDYINKNRSNLLPELQEALAKAGNKSSGTWEEVFGKGDYTDELFMAWNYSQYLDKVTAAGKAEYSLPTFVNAWIVQPEDKHPGDYPSGGPQAQNHDIWRAGAPNIDILSPDIYLPDFPAIINKYARSSNPVFIPESAAGANGAANVVYALGQMGAIGYSPFGIDSRLSSSPDDVFTRTYGTLASLTDLITAHQAAGTIGAAWLSPGLYEDMTISLGGYDINVFLTALRNPTPARAPGFAMVFNMGPDEFLVFANNAYVTFAPSDKKGIVGLAKTQEGVYKDGQWVSGRWLNGDETQLRYDLLKAVDQGQSGFGLMFRGNGPSMQRVWLYKY